MENLAIGAVSASVILSILLRMLYNTFSISNKAKPWIAVSIGIFLGIVALFYNSETIDFKHIVDYAISGFMTGATAVGLYEMVKGRKT